MRTYLKASIVAVSLLIAGVLVSPSAQVQIQRGYGFVTQMIIGSASTDGCLLDVSLGVLRIREGDNSADCPMSAGNVTSSATVTGVTLVGDYAGNLIRFGGGGGRSRIASATNGVLQISNNDASNTVDITLADWGTKQSAESVSVANAGVLAGPTSGVGKLIVSIDTDNRLCEFELTGTAAPVEVYDGGAICSITAGTATSLNVYYSAGYQIQNNRGATRGLRVTFIGG